MLAFSKAMTLSHTFLTIGTSLLIGITLGGLGLLSCTAKEKQALTTTSPSLKPQPSRPSIDLAAPDNIETATFALG
jgi:hypothetical protein